MRPEEFEERFRHCRELPGSNDPAYRSTFNEVIMEAGGSIRVDPNTNPETLERLTAAGADDKNRQWRDIGASPKDARLAAFSELYADADPDQRTMISDFFDGEELRELDVFVARSARLFEATGDLRWLRRGLAAACIEGGRYDFRDLISSLSILRYGAERAGIEVEPFFHEALEMESTKAPSLQDIFFTVKSYPKQTLRNFVRKFGPPEWKDEVSPDEVKSDKVKPWWKFW
jgi:hypothetical protein